MVGFAYFEAEVAVKFVKFGMVPDGFFGEDIDDPGVLF